MTIEAGLKNLLRRKRSRVRPRKRPDPFQCGAEPGKPMALPA